MNDNLETTCVKLFRERHTFSCTSARQEFGSQQIFDRIAGRLLHQLSAHYTAVFGILLGCEDNQALTGLVLSKMSDLLSPLGE